MQFSFDQFILDTESYSLSHDGMAVHAEPQAIELLTFLIKNRGRVVSREELNENVWKGRTVSDSAISSRIKTTRRLLGDDGQHQLFIKTISKKGFSFVADVKENADNETEDISKNNGSAAFDSRPSLVVLPFANLGDNSDQQYISEGMTEDIVTTLSKVSKLVVLSYPSPENDKSRSVDASKIGRDLGADYVLTGSVQSEGKRLRISAHLLETNTGQHLWDQSYDHENEDIFKVQDSVTMAVVSALQVELTEGDQALLFSRGTDNIEAWRLTFEGQASVLTHDQDSVRRGLRQLEKAVKLDNKFSLAWAALSTAHWKEFLNRGWSTSAEASLEKSIAASDRALQLEPDNAAALAMRGLIFVSLEKFDEAKAMAEEAMLYANTESNSIAIAGIVLRACCEPEMSINYTRKAMRFCPIYPAWYPYGISLCFWIQQKYDLAVESAQEAVNIDPNVTYTHFALAMIHAEMDNVILAQEAVGAILRIDPQFSRKAYTDGMPFKDIVIEQRREAALIKAAMP